MKFLPYPVFLYIYSYVGHNSLYLNKSYYKCLMDRRKEFVERPLKLEYRLCRWKQRNYDNNYTYRKRQRASLYVEPEISFEISGNVILGDIDKESGQVQFTKKFEDELIPVSVCKHTAYPTPCMIVNYWTIYSLSTKEIDRLKKYKDLWVSDYNFTFSGPGGPLSF